MPNRILREGILTSERVNSLDWDAEVFYRRLMSVVDDFGRYVADPRLLRAALYPLQIEKVRDSNITRWLDACVEAGLIFVYSQSGASTDRSGNQSGASSDRSSVGDRASTDRSGNQSGASSDRSKQKEKLFLVMLDFRQQIRAKESKYPHPPDTYTSDDVQVHSTRIADAHLGGGGGGDEVVIPTPPRVRGDPFQMHNDWKPSENFHSLVKQSGLVPGKDGELNASVGEFIAYWLTQPRSRTQHEWDHALLKSLKADKLHTVGGAKKSPSSGNWRTSNEGIERKGVELGLRAKVGESYPDYARRIDAEIEERNRRATT